MLKILAIMGSLILSFVTGYIIARQKEKDENSHDEKTDDFSMSVQSRRNSSMGRNSKTATQIKLKNDLGTCNAYFNDENVFAAFYFKHVDDPHLSITTKNEIMADFEDGECFFMGVYQDHFANLLNRGEVVIFSKTEGKLIEMIYRENMENSSDYRTAKPQVYDYYLPDGVAFFTSARPFMSDPIFNKS